MAAYNASSVFQKPHFHVLGTPYCTVQGRAVRYKAIVCTAEQYNTVYHYKSWNTEI